MGCCDTRGLISLDDAKHQLLQAVKAKTATELIDLNDALDRILAHDIKASFSVPAYNNSAMDGYALKASELDNNSTLTQIAKVFAGKPFQGQLKAGQCVRIMTGAAIPNGADCVVMQEETQAQGELIHFDSKPKINDHIRFAGEDIREGEAVLAAGKRLGPADIGLLASLGQANIEVFKPLKVAIFSTGDELRLPGETLDDGCIYDSNRFVVAAMLKRLGAEVLNLGIIPDDPDQLESVFLTAAQQCDAVITSGGVSVGEADYTKTILEKIGRVDFWKIAIKPGKPFAFGHIENAMFFGLPGNPVAAAVTFHQLALPTLQALAGEQCYQPLQLNIPTASPLKKQPGRIEFQRAVMTESTEGELTVNKTGDQGSGILSSMSKANCYIKLASECQQVSPSENVEVIPFDRWMV